MRIFSKRSVRLLDQCYKPAGYLGKYLSCRHYSRRVPPGNPNLDIEQINNLLGQFATSWKINHDPNSLILRIDSSAVASNSPIEDCHFQTILKDGGVSLGVLDGHWNTDCSRLVAYALPHYIEKHLDEQKSVSKSLRNAFEALDKDIINLPFKALPTAQSLDDIKKMDKQTKLIALQQSLPAFAGSCAITSYIHGKDLYIAHAGDCRAILGIRGATNWKGRALTEDHQPSNLRELSRLQHEHPNEDATVAFNAGDGPLRVLGGMMPSRAFGDGRYKWSLEDQDRIDELTSNLGVNLTATPDICHHQITASDAFLVICSDGIFDVFSSTQVVGHIVDWLNTPTIDSNAATYLIRQALGEDRGVSHLSRMLTMEPAIARRWRDDMTVQVVFFRTVEDILEVVDAKELKRCSN
ncbi:Pyruvate dehyrogenase phosphatase catalytic subunit [Globomyces sp. JEL0801]|nr:Pyruvate dehyrogenase phosphatase catalytic subunit [Globomyces sp. JEL0801]